MNSRKSQAGMFEIIIVLFVFFLLIGFGLIFYARLQKESFDKGSKQALEFRVVRVAQVASSLPELQCSIGNSIKENCFELEKIEAAKTIISQNTPDYYDMFGFGKIQVFEIYPEEKSWQIYESKPLKQYDATVIQIPISIYDSVEKKNYFGVLNVTVYS